MIPTKWTTRIAYPEIVRFHLKSDGLPPLLGDSDEVGVHESCTPTSSESLNKGGRSSDFK